MGSIGSMLSCQKNLENQNASVDVNITNPITNRLEDNEGDKPKNKFSKDYFKSEVDELKDKNKEQMEKVELDLNLSIDKSNKDNSSEENALSNVVRVDRKAVSLKQEYKALFTKNALSAKTLVMLEEVYFIYSITNYIINYN